MRQLRSEVGRDHALFMHLTLLPYIRAAGELKTKPTQHSVKELRSIGIQPDVLICRSETEMSETERAKIALFTDVERNAVFSAVDVKTIYEIPRHLHDQGLDICVLGRLNLPAKSANLKAWDQVVDAIRHPEKTVTIAMVGKYMELADAYKSLNEALLHAGIKNRAAVKIVYVEAEKIEREGASKWLGSVDGVLVPGGFGNRGVEGKIQAVHFARLNGVPYLGICLGMQVALIEYARHVLNLKEANSTEFDKNTKDPVVSMISEWLDREGKVEQRNEQTDLGGTMRLGAQACQLMPGTLSRQLYGKEIIHERHRHRYEVNNQYVERFEAAGLKVAGRSGDNKLVEMVEIPAHPWFVGCQFHPEFTSTPRDGHPLFQGFIKAALEYQKKDKELL